MVAKALPAGPPFPVELGYLWRHFIELSQGLSGGGFGPAVITWADLRDWQEQMGVALELWEKRALMRLGNLRALILSEQTAGNGSQNKN